MEDNIIWYNKDGRFYNCSSCSMPNCSSRNTTSKSNCLLDKHEVTAQEIDNKVMKANGTPDKIYLQVCGDCPQIDCENCKFEDFEDNITWCKDRIFPRDIEYTRTDAFIEKACEWIREFNNHHYIMRYSDSCEPPLSEVTEWFKNYMKGE